MKLSRNSWHYKLNEFLHDGYLPSSKCQDFCSYFWTTMFSFLKMLVLIGMFLFIGTVFVIGWRIVLIFLAVAILIALILGGYKMASNKLEDTPEGFFRASYRKFREKTCHKLEWSE